MAMEPRLIAMKSEVEMAIKLPAIVSTESSSRPADFLANADRVLVEIVSTG